MNRKCFCCFNNMNTNNEDNKDDELLKDWIEFGFEKLESNLTEEDKKHALNYDTFVKRFLVLFLIKILIMFLIFLMILEKNY